MKISLYFVTAFVVLITRTESARILATIFTPSYSHQVTFRPLWRELAKRGHEIVLLTTDPMREPELNNLKEIDLKGSYEVMEQHGASEVISNARGRGNKELLDTYMTALSKTADWQLSQPEVQDLIRNESEHFDLIMVEMMFPTHLGFVDSDMISLPVNLSPSKSVPTQAMGVVLLLVFAVVPILMQTECARILGIIPTASYSHQAPFQPFWRQLSLRGHQVTVMTTNPANDPSLTNLTEIDLSFTYEIYSKYNFTEFVSDDTNSFLEIAQAMKTMLNEAGDFQFGHPQVQNLIHNKGVTFNLVIVEAQLPAMMSFSWRFNCPMIGIASLDSGMQYHLAMGNPVHPIVNPDLNQPVEDAEDMTFKERMSSFVYHFGYTRYLYDHAYPNLQVKLRTIFGEDLPDLLKLHDNMAMLFINTHPIFHSIRPLNPNTIPIGGGIHLKKPEPLAEEIQSHLDNSKEGAIYVSFGTNVNARMANSVITVILEALGELPYRVLLKADLKLEKTPRNVITHKWLPQQDILRHPNVKLFVTQGGLQSLQEAVYNAVPLVGIPFLGDQIANVNRMVKKGYGLKLNKNDVTRESLKRVVLEVMNNPKYSEKVRELSAIYREEEMPSLEKAIWWTEYVIRHKGGRHLRSVAVDMPFWKYFMLDVIGLLLSVLVLFTFTCYRITNHQTAFKPLWLELAKRGHKITLIQSQVTVENNENITHILLNDTYRIMNKGKMFDKIAEGQSIIKALVSALHSLFESMEYQLSHPGVQELLASDKKVDLFFTEFLATFGTALGRKLNASMIGLVSMDSSIHGHLYVGNPTHPVMYPDKDMPFYPALTFKERVMDTFFWVAFKLSVDLIFNPMMERVAAKCLGEVDPLEDIAKEVSLLFINANPLFNAVRPLGPKTVNIGGGLHLLEPQPLPEDLQDYLDNAENGVIYFSLGSNINSKQLPNITKKIILETFSQLPYKILWKFNEEIPGKSNNVKVMKWIPQQDVLRHKNVKLFITQGGLQSMEEAIFNYVPMLALPFYGDQNSNARKMAAKGIGLTLDYKKLNVESFKSAILEVLDNPRYRETTKELAELVMDQPMTGLEKAVWWTEYVLRHGRTEHFRDRSVDTPWYQFLLLDVISFVLAATAVAIYVFVKILRLLKWLVIKLHYKLTDGKKTKTS